MGLKRPHTIALTSVWGSLGQIFGGQPINTNATIDVAPEDNPANEPEPDLIVLAKPSHEYPVDNPKPSDPRLVVEVSDSTLGFDLTIKARLYARAGIIEYWVFDIEAQSLVVHRSPQKGSYQSVTVYSKHESVSPLASPDHEFRVADAFPD